MNRKNLREPRKPDISALIGDQKKVYNYLKDFHESGYQMFCLEGYAGTGKAQPLDSRVLTPDGWVMMGDIKVGDYVISEKGEKTKVTHIHPQGKKDIYKVNFSDGTSSRCCDDHLWKFIDSKEKSRIDKKDQHLYNWEVKPLKEIKDKIDDGIFIPYTRPIQFEEREYKIPPHRIADLCVSYIPEKYFFGSVNQRLSVLRGLLYLDTIRIHNGKIQFRTEERSLCYDVFGLVKSLGGSPSCIEVNEDDEFSFSFVLYGLGLEEFLDQDDDAPYIENNHIVDIEYVGKQKAQCITVEDETHTYITEGYNVTHNSFCLNMFVEDQIYEYGTRICLSAPTHKALTVLKQMAEFKSDNLEYYTIHSLLGLKPVVTSDGKETFVKDNKSSNKIMGFDLVIVDEASMLDDKLFSFLVDEINNNAFLKIIFVGDSKQLPPVNHVCSAPMDSLRREKHNIGHVVLTQIIRQKDSNPIINFSKEIRNGRFNPKTDLNTESQGVLVVNKKDQLAVLSKMFTSGKYEEDMNYCRMVAWTNNTVNWYNELIRKMIYKAKIENRIAELKEDSGKLSPEMIEVVKSEFPYYRNGKMDLPRYLVGDKVIVDKPIFDIESRSQIICKTNEELLITNLSIQPRIAMGVMYDCYIAHATNIFTNEEVKLEICHESSLLQLEQSLDKLKRDALKAPRGKKSRDLWVRYYKLDKHFARLKYAPCLTTYKSQGSTYENIIIVVDDIMRNPKRAELLQHLYVGVTRASMRCFLFV